MIDQNKPRVVTFTSGYVTVGFNANGKREEDSTQLEGGSSVGYIHGQGFKLNSPSDLKAFRNAVLKAGFLPDDLGVQKD